jgi:hypothetical protein
MKHALRAAISITAAGGKAEAPHPKPSFSSVYLLDFVLRFVIAIAKSNA